MASEHSSSSSSSQPLKPLPLERSYAQLYHTPEDIQRLAKGLPLSSHSTDSSTSSHLYRTRCMRFRDIPKDSDCLFHINVGHSIAFHNDDPGLKFDSNTYLANNQYTHVIYIHHASPVRQSESIDIDTLNDHVSVLSLRLVENPVADTKPDPPKIPVTEEKLASMYEWIKPSGLGITIEKLRDILMPEEDVTDRQNVLNLTVSQLRAVREFVAAQKRNGDENLASTTDDDAEHDSSNKKLLVLTPRNRRTDGMAIVVASMVTQGKSRARQVISALDEREDLEDTPWSGVLEMSVAGRLDADTLF